MLQYYVLKNGMWFSCSVGMYHEHDGDKIESERVLTQDELNATLKFKKANQTGGRKI